MTTEQSALLQEVLAANEQHVENFGDKSSRPLPPDRHRGPTFRFTIQIVG